MDFSSKLVKAKFIKRYKRFFSDHILEDGSLVTAHCANTGAMLGVTEEGITSWLSKSNDPKRKLKWSWELAQKEKTIIGINTHHPNKIVQEAIIKNKIKELSNYADLKREVKYGTNSKIDILLQDTHKKDCYVEIKNVHLSREEGVAEFPDAVTTRGAKHLRELSLVAKSGQRAVMLYLIQRNDCKFFKIAEDIDEIYAREFYSALKAGVEVICIDTILNVDAINIGKNIQLLSNK
ncbi:MAG: DNA/RNA nuclease SfsA [Alphaproteobacteria bacterium]|tara:strand:- start:3917 stop:4624 length:708 start_codon:yes stop_codon:yes gene_type:complete